MTNNSSNETAHLSPQQYDSILSFQQKILSAVATADEQSQPILDEICLLAEQLSEGAVASVLLLDPNTQTLNPAAAPSVPPSALPHLMGLTPSPYSGSCGNAVFHNESQYIQNTFCDIRWRDLKQFAIDFNICSCWSNPIRNKAHAVIGSFALSSFEHRVPSAFHKKLLETAATLISIVLEKQQNLSRIRLLAHALDHAKEGLIITDANNNIIEVNQAVLSIYGYSEQQLIGQNPKIFSSGIQDKAFYQQMWQHILQYDFWQGEITNKHADGRLITQWMSIKAIRDTEGHINRHLALFTDITELKQAQQKLEYVAFTDATTQLYNKNYLEHQLQQTTTPATLLLLNINNFSYINTAYGYEMGDNLLAQVARILSHQFNADLVCRLNSDEFALLFPNTIDKLALIDNIRQYFYNNTLILGDMPLQLSFNFGVATGNEHLLRNSAIALKQSKKLGKNRYVIFDDSTKQAQQQQQHFIETTQVLHQAISQHQLLPYFQGIYNNQHQAITKFEALARIQQPHQLITPDRFLEPARLTGLLPLVTQVMIERSFQQMQNYPFSFSINITEDDLSRNFLIDFLQQKVEQYHIDPQRVILEILEGVSTSGKKNHLQQLAQLKQLGFKLAIDDFGTEYSNYERLLALDIDYLKIDGHYIKDIDHNPKSQDITEAIVFFAHKVGIPCIAEFVHSEAVQQKVVALGIEYSQGYLFSKPSPLPISSK